MSVQSQQETEAHSAPSAYQLSLLRHEIRCAHSHLFNLYHEIPKYVCNAPRNSKHLKSVERKFKVNGDEYRVVLHPARIARHEEGIMSTTEQFPGVREEFIEDVILKIALDKNRFLAVDGVVLAECSIYEIQKELRKVGHAYSYYEIKEAIEVLHGTKMIIKDTKGEMLWGTGTYADFLLSTEKNVGKGYVVLHAIVCDAIKKGTFRQFDYSLSMGLSGRYCRRIYKELASKFTWASPLNRPYQMHLFNFLDRHSFTIYSRISDNAKQFRAALDELIGKRVVRSYVERKVGPGRKVTDCTYDIFPAPEFISAMKRSTAIRNEVQRQLIENSFPTSLTRKRELGPLA